MKKLAMAALLVMAVSKAHAASGYLGTDDQLVHLNTVTTTTVQGTVAVTGDVNSTVVNVPTVTVSGSVAVTGNVNATVVNPVLVTSSNTVIKDAGGDALAINADGSINTSITLSSDTASITTYQAEGTTDTVLNIGQPNLFGKTMVEVSSMSMVTSGVLSTTGLAKQVEVTALSGECTFSVNGGPNFILPKNTFKVKPYDYLLSNPSVTLVAKDGGATCRAEILTAQ